MDPTRLSKTELNLFFVGLVACSIACLIAMACFSINATVNVLRGSLIATSLVAVGIYTPTAISIAKHGLDGVAMARFGISLHWLISAIALCDGFYRSEFLTPQTAHENIVRGVYLIGWYWAAILMIAAVGLIDRKPVRWNVCAAIWATVAGGAVTMAIHALRGQF